MDSTLPLSRKRKAAGSIFLLFASYFIFSRYIPEQLNCQPPDVLSDTWLHVDKIISQICQHCALTCGRGLNLEADRWMDGRMDGSIDSWMVSFSTIVHYTQRWPRAILMSRAVRISDIRVEVKWTVMSSSTGMFINTNLCEKRTVFVIEVTTLWQNLTTMYCSSLTD